MAPRVGLAGFRAIRYLGWMVDQFAGNGDKRTPAEYLAPLNAPQGPRTEFAQAMLDYLDLPYRDGRDGKRDGRRAAMIQALDGRATWIMIRHWLRGTNRAPQWAKELLAIKSERRAKALAKNVEKLRANP